MDDDVQSTGDVDRVVSQGDVSHPVVCDEPDVSYVAPVAADVLVSETPSTVAANVVIEGTFASEVIPPVDDINNVPNMRDLGEAPVLRVYNAGTKKRKLQTIGEKDRNIRGIVANVLGVTSEMMQKRQKTTTIPKKSYS